MSASSKKKLRKEQEAAKLTEKQLTQQKEDKKLKVMTITFITILALIIVSAGAVMLTKTIAKSGIRQRNTVALTINGEDISSAELNYFYVDGVNNFYTQLQNTYGEYATAYAKMLYQLDFTLPLDDQIQDEATGKTWADYFIEQAIYSAKSAYAICQEANAKGHTLNEDEKGAMEASLANMEMFAGLYGYTDMKSYLEGMYGFGSNEESFRKYYEMNTLATSYQAAYSESLTYDDAALRAYEGETPEKYSSYDYALYSVASSKFLTGGTKDESGNTTYSDEETAASVTAAEEAAKALADSATSLEELNKAIAAMEINKDVENAKATEYTDQLYTSINADIAEWLADSSRKEGDVTVITNSYEGTDADGNKSTVVNGYYVVLFQKANDNTYTLPAVRHLLVAFEGGVQTPDGNTSYSDEEKAAAKAKAEELLKQWQDGDATEETFSALVTKNTDDTASAEDGGLYEDIYPGQMVPEFEEWCFAEGRKVGDTGIVETTYGYHIMFYANAGETTYRDFMVSNAKRSEDINAWFEALMDALTVKEGNTKLLNRQLKLS